MSTLKTTNLQHASAANPNIVLTSTGEVKIADLEGLGTDDVVVDENGTLIRNVLPFSWDASTDAYVTRNIAYRDIEAQVRMRRCLVTDAGAVTYLDADDSTKLAGDWIRLCETCELSTPNTGTFGSEVSNELLRDGVSAWSAGTYTEGDVVTHSGSVWECLATSTTATPAADTTSATLTGGSGQVMVEVPCFSVKHVTTASGSFNKHEFYVKLGNTTADGFEPHPAFVLGGGGVRDYFYYGAYKGSGTGCKDSVSGGAAGTGVGRHTCRSNIESRGTGWHNISYWQANALQWLYVTEYQDMNSQRALGDGANAGSGYNVAAGASNGRGNRCGHSSTGTLYMSYRGVENWYGRRNDWLDGINVNSTTVYVSGNYTDFADDTATNYTNIGSLGGTSAQYIRDIDTDIALLPVSTTGGSSSTYVADTNYYGVGWRGLFYGGDAAGGQLNGAFLTNSSLGYQTAGNSIGGRPAYVAQN